MSKTIVIIPCYNEEERLPKQEFVDAFVKYPQLSFLFVNDGSKDQTLEILKMWEEKYDNVIALDKQPNSGKANTVRYGMNYAQEHLQFDFIAYFDADLATPIYEIQKFKQLFTDYPNLMLVAGSRVRRMGSNINRNWKRHIIGRIFATFASATLMLPFYDTQCGAKMIKKESIADLFAEEFISKWLFDVEVLARLTIKFGLKKAKEIIYEQPLNEWNEVENSKIKLKDFFRFPVDLWKINRKYHKQIKKTI